MIPNKPPTMSCKTNHCGYSVKFSPFSRDRIAVATAQHYGIVGAGWQAIYERSPRGLEEIWSQKVQHGVFDCAWSEVNRSILLSACADGSVKIWETEADPTAGPIESHQEHFKEVSSVTWNLLRDQTYLSTSWDETIKLWDFGSPNSTCTFLGHRYCVYMAAWHPVNPFVFASASGDHSVKQWDIRQETSTVSLNAHNAEILGIDWCKYNECVFATGGIDKLIRTWDIRAPGKPIAEFTGHRYGIRRVLFSPHQENLLLSCSYDMTVRLWDVSKPCEDSLVRVWGHHSEFAIGIDFCVHERGLIGSVGWDETLHLWNHEPVPAA